MFKGYDDGKIALFNFELPKNFDSTSRITHIINPFNLHQAFNCAVKILKWSKKLNVHLIAGSIISTIKLI